MNEEMLESLARQGAEMSNFEGLEEFEDYVAQKYGMNANTKRALKEKINRYRYGNARGNNPTKPFQGQSSGDLTQGNALTFTLNVLRKTAGIAAVLPVPMFGMMDLQSAYSKVLGGKLPAGVTLKGFKIGYTAGVLFAQKAEFIYTDGTNDDTIEVTCPNNPYPSLILATQTDVMQMRGIRYSLSDKTKVAQFSTDLTVERRSLAGRSTQDNLSPSNYKSPDQFQDGIIDIKEIISIDKNSTIVTGIIAQASFSIDLNFYAGRIDKLDASNELR